MNLQQRSDFTLFCLGCGVPVDGVKRLETD